MERGIVDALTEEMRRMVAEMRMERSRELDTLSGIYQDYDTWHSNTTWPDPPRPGNEAPRPHPQDAGSRETTEKRRLKVVAVAPVVANIEVIVHSSVESPRLSWRPFRDSRNGSMRVCRGLITITTTYVDGRAEPHSHSRAHGNGDLPVSFGSGTASSPESLSLFLNRLGKPLLLAVWGRVYEEIVKDILLQESLSLSVVDARKSLLVCLSRDYWHKRRPVRRITLREAESWITSRGIASTDYRNLHPRELIAPHIITDSLSAYMSIPPEERKHLPLFAGEGSIAPDLEYRDE